MQPPGWHRTPAPDRPQDGSAPLEPLVENGPPAAPDRLSRVQNGRYEDFLRSSVDWLWETDADLMLAYVSSPVAHSSAFPPKRSPDGRSARSAASRRAAARTGRDRPRSRRAGRSATRSSS